MNQPMKRLAVIIIGLLYFGCFPSSDPAPDPGPRPSFTEAERMIVEGAAACQASVAHGAMNKAIDAAVELYWDNITSTANYAVSSTATTAPVEMAVRRKFSFSNAQLEVLVTPDAIDIFVAENRLRFFWDSESIIFSNEDAVEEWTKIGDPSTRFNVLATVSLSDWSCQSPAGMAKASAAVRDDFGSDGPADAFYFEGGITTATPAHISLKSYKENYHIGYCDSAGCDIDRGTMSTIARLTSETVGPDVEPRLDAPRFSVPTGKIQIPSKVVDLLREVQNIQAAPSYQE